MPQAIDIIRHHMQLFGLQTQIEPCFGLAHVAMQSMLIGKLIDFDKRMKKMCGIKPTILAEQINIAEQNRQAKKMLNASDQLLVEIPVFLQAVKLCQEAYLHPEIYTEHEHPLTQDAERALALVASISIAKQGKIFSGCYKADELETYCQTLREQIQKSALPFSLILISGRHAISLGYDRETDEWLLVDPYKSPTERIKENDHLAKQMLIAFSANDTAIFSTACYTPLKDVDAGQTFLNEWLSNVAMQAIHTVTQEKAAEREDSHQATWLYVAAQCGEIGTAEALLQLGANPNMVYKDLSSPLFVSIQNRHADMTDLLKKYHANPEQPGIADVTPLSLEIHPQVHHHIGFGTKEHEIIGDGAKIRGVDGKPLAELEIYRLEKDNQLSESAHPDLQKVTFSQLVALPDYYGLRQGAISNYKDPNQTDEIRKTRFGEAFNQLAVAKDLEHQVEDIDHIARENDNEYKETVKDVICCGTTFLTLLEENYDHFAPDAWFAYKAGHEKALELAKVSHDLRSEQPAKAKKYLETAYAIEGFACHYVSDNFSAGHIRTPRRGLVELFGNEIGGALSNSMHDEENAAGIAVKNARGDEWICFGDGNLNSIQNTKNKEMVIELVKNSAGEIYTAFETGLAPSAEQFIAKQLIPKSVDDLDYAVDKPFQLGPKLVPTQMPLFKEENGKIYVRHELENRKCTDYEEVTKFHAVVDAARLRIESRNAPLQTQVEEKIQDVSPSSNYLDILKTDINTVATKYIGYSSAHAFFSGARDSHHAALQLQQAIAGQSINIKNLYTFIYENPQAKKLIADLATAVGKYAERMKWDNPIQSRLDILTYLEKAFGLEPYSNEEATSLVCTC